MAHNVYGFEMEVRVQWLEGLTHPISIRCTSSSSSKPVQPGIHKPKIELIDIITQGQGQTEGIEKDYLVVGLLPRNAAKFQKKPLKGGTIQAALDGYPYFVVIPRGNHDQAKFYALCESDNGPPKLWSVSSDRVFYFPEYSWDMPLAAGRPNKPRSRVDKKKEWNEYVKGVAATFVLGPLPPQPEKFDPAVATADYPRHETDGFERVWNIIREGFLEAAVSPSTNAASLKQVLQFLEEEFPGIQDEPPQCNDIKLFFDIENPDEHGEYTEGFEVGYSEFLGRLPVDSKMKEATLYDVVVSKMARQAIKVCIPP